MSQAVDDSWWSPQSVLTRPPNYTGKSKIVVRGNLLTRIVFLQKHPLFMTLRSCNERLQPSHHYQNPRKMSFQQLPEIQLLSTGTALPIPTFTIHREISGTPTELSVQTYDDRIMVLLGQLGNKVGCLVSQPSSAEHQRRGLNWYTITDASISPSINTPDITQRTSYLDCVRRLLDETPFHAPDTFDFDITVTTHRRASSANAT